MAGLLFRFQLKRVITRISAIHDRPKGLILAQSGSYLIAERRQCRIERRLRRGYLIRVAKDLEVRTFGPDVCWTDYDLPRQLVFEIEIPLVINRRLRLEILARHTGELHVAGVHKTCKSGSRRERYCRGGYPIAGKSGLKKEREVVGELQWVAGASFIKGKEASVTGADGERLRMERAVSYAYARGKIIFVGRRQF